MQTINVIYLNDTQHLQIVFTDTLHGPSRVLRPAEHGVFKVQIKPEGAVFVKTWGERVLISASDTTPEE